MNNYLLNKLVVIIFFTIILNLFAGFGDSNFKNLKKDILGNVQYTDDALGLKVSLGKKTTASDLVMVVLPKSIKNDKVIVKVKGFSPGKRQNLIVAVGNSKDKTTLFTGLVRIFGKKIYIRQRNKNGWSKTLGEKKGEIKGTSKYYNLEIIIDFSKKETTFRVNDLSVSGKFLFSTKQEINWVGFGVEKDTISYYKEFEINGIKLMGSSEGSKKKTINKKKSKDNNKKQNQDNKKLIKSTLSILDSKILSLPDDVNIEKIKKIKLNLDRKETPPSTFFIDFKSGNDNNPGTKDKPWKHHPWDPEASRKPASIKGNHTYIFKKGVIYAGTLVAVESGNSMKPIEIKTDSKWGKGDAFITGGEIISTSWKKCKKGQFSGIPDKDIDNIWYTDWKGAYKPRRLTEIRNGKVKGLHFARMPDYNPEIHLKSDEPRSYWWEAPQVIIVKKLYVEDISGFKKGDTVIGTGKWADKDENRMNIAKGKNYISHVGDDYIEIMIFKMKKGEFTKNAYVQSQNANQLIKKVSRTHNTYRMLQDKEHLTCIDKNWLGGYIWIEESHGVFPKSAKIWKIIPDKNIIIFHKTKSVNYSRYYIENIPQALNAESEFYYNWRIKKLFVRLDGDLDPNKTTLIVGKYYYCINIVNQGNIKIEGLYFTGCNELEIGEWIGNVYHRHRYGPSYNAAILMKGGVRNILINKCKFKDVINGVSGRAILLENDHKNNILDNIKILNCDFKNIDGSAVTITSGFEARYKIADCHVQNISVLSNNTYNTGFRIVSLWTSIENLAVRDAVMVEMAYNNVKRSFLVGVFCEGPKYYNRSKTVYPLQRILVHHNYIDDCLLSAQDFGGLALWHGGPMYAYCNTIINPVGYKNVDYKLYYKKKKDWYRTTCYGVGIYADQGYKTYVFNNLIIGKNNNVNDRIYNSAAWNEAQGFLNMVFNNTMYNFGVGLHKGMKAHNRCYYLNNLMIDMGLKFVDQEPAESYIEFDSTALGYNVFKGKPKWFGRLGKSGNFEKISGFQDYLDEKKVMLSQTGVVETKKVVQDAVKHNFKPLAGTKVIDGAPKVFVPWGLYDVVGEWPFHLYNKDSAIVIDEHINWNEHWKNRYTVQKTVPRNHLKAHNIYKSDYIDGILESWIKSCLRLDGKSKYLSFTKSADMEMDKNNFLIEIVIRTSSTGPVVGKMEKLSGAIGKGYLLVILKNGMSAMFLKFDNKNYFLQGSKIAVNDNKWHHILAEVDRKNKTVMIYIDGKIQNSGSKGKFLDTSLKNKGNFLVGKYKDKYLKADIDFMRVSRGTLSDAQTSIKELYDWQFKGPFLRDFYGKKTTGKARDVGAIEY